MTLLGATLAQATTNFPFPRNGTYAYGIKSEAGASTMATNVQTAYADWLSNQYVESGDYARIKFDDASYTVSEGIGYGMLIMVYMDNTTNNTQSKFDKLWNYYKKWENSNGLMNWKISDFSSVNGSNGATDGDLDVAVALMMAYKQWGDAQYLTDAKTLIAAIGKYELSTTHSGLLKPGDMWESSYNPSYVSGVALHLFQQVNTTYAWSSALSANLTMLANNANSTSGLPSDWCSYDGTPVSGNSSIQFGYDAVRTPWRVAWDYAWYGDATAKTLNDKIATWITAKATSPSSIKAGYSLDGSGPTVSYSNATYTGALVASAMSNSSHQSWLTSGWTALVDADASSYYNRSLKVLYELLLSGNLNNFWDGTPAPTKSQFTLTPVATNGTISFSPAAANNTYDSASKVIATATPSSGYRFTGWSGASTSTTSLCTVTVDANKTLTANFAKIPSYKLATAATNGTIALSPTGPSYDSGTSVTATATAAAGYTFSGWSGACTGTSTTCTVKMSKDTTLTATFAKNAAPKYALTITAPTGGTIIATPSASSYDSGTAVKLVARPDYGYKLTGWSGDCNGSDSTCSLTMNAAHSVTANFTQAPMEKIAMDGFSGGTLTFIPAMSSDSTFPLGSVVKIVAVPASGYTFSGWIDSCTDKKDTCTITMGYYQHLGVSFSPVSTGISHRLLGGVRLGMAEGVLTFDPSDMGKARLDMVDLKGRVVPLWQGETNSVGQVSLRNVPTGLYFVRLRSASSSYQQMIQVLH